MPKMNNLYKKAFETYDLIVNWVIENHNDVVDEITQKNMNIDWAYRLLKGMADEIGRLNERIEEQREYKEYFKSCYASITDENERLADKVDELEKRDSPMKVIYKQGKSYCPIKKHRVYKGQKYCAYCGQKLDWKN